MGDKASRRAGETARPPDGRTAGRLTRRAAVQTERLLAALLFLCPAVWGAGTDPVVVALQTKAGVGDGEVVVGDVASVRGGDAALRRRIAQLDLADPLQEGRPVTITREQIEYRVRLAGVRPAQFRFEGERQVQVAAARHEVAAEEVLEAAKQLVLDRLPLRGEDVSMELIQPIREPIVVAAHAESVRLNARFPSSRLPLGRVRADVEISADGKRLLDVPVYLDVRGLQMAAVATRDLRRGEVLGEKDLREERREIASPAEISPSPRDLVGKRVKRDLRALEAIRAGDVEMPSALATAVVKPRDVVELVARRGVLRVTAKGEAMQAGRVGQTIQVRNLSSKTIVLGRVVNRSVVEVPL